MVAIGGALAGGVVIGVIIGYFGKSLLSEPAVVVPPVQVIQEKISDEDLANLCAELTADQKTKAVEAQKKVETLQQQIAEKERELARYKEQAKKDEKRRAAAAKKWKAMEDEIASLRIQLAAAIEERDEVKKELDRTIAELKKTSRKLDEQIRETQKQKARAEHYKAESTQNLWAAFLANAKVEICDRGTRKRHARCHEAVEQAFDQDMRARFTTCVDTWQAVPVLKQAPKRKDFQLPQFAEWLPDDNKFTKKGWYVIYCDPTLPEATDVMSAPSEPGSEPVEPELQPGDIQLDGE